MHAIISDANYKPCLESNLKYFIFILPFSHIYYIMLFHHGKKSLAQWFNSQCYKKKISGFTGSYMDWDCGDYERKEKKNTCWRYYGMTG